jgi:hypothetical protein
LALRYSLTFITTEAEKAASIVIMKTDYEIAKEKTKTTYLIKVKSGINNKWSRRKKMKIWKELLNLPEHLSSLSVLSDFRVTRSLVLCVCFPDRCPFVLFLLAIVFSILVRFTYFNYPSGIIKLFLYRFLNRPETDIPLPI